MKEAVTHKWAWQGLVKRKQCEAGSKSALSDVQVVAEQQAGNDGVVKS